MIIKSRRLRLPIDMSCDTRGIGEYHYESISEFTPNNQHQFIMGKAHWTFAFFFSEVT